jgi:hypothetical protein
LRVGKINSELNDKQRFFARADGLELNLIFWWYTSRRKKITVESSRSPGYSVFIKVLPDHEGSKIVYKIVQGTNAHPLAQ